MDAHVGKHIFENVIGSKNESVLKNKTRLWVTNQVSYLSNVDHILFLKDGQVIEQGSFEELMKSNGPLFNFIQDHATKKEDDEEESKMKEISKAMEVETKNEKVEE